MRLQDFNQVGKETQSLLHGQHELDPCLDSLGRGRIECETIEWSMYLFYFTIIKRKV